MNQEVIAYRKHMNLKLAAAELGVAWQSLYVRLKQLGEPVTGDKMRYGGGTKERKELASNTSGGVYRLARDAGYPKDKYRLLCHNCNCAIGWYGYCPHTKEPSCG